VADKSVAEVRELKALYKNYEKIISARLGEFDALRSAPVKRIFGELCFCICTPQSNALLAAKAIGKLTEEGRLYSTDAACIRECLYGVRFPNNKSRYIADAASVPLEEIMRGEDDMKVREEIVAKVKGIGLKEASHFLRNVGRAEDLAILDVHILKNLKVFGVIKEIPETLTKNRYYEIEEKMRGFARKLGIPLRALDLLLWAKETGHVFK